MNDTVGPSVPMKYGANGKTAKANICGPIFANFSHKTGLVNITGGRYGCHVQTQVASQYYNATITNMPVSISSPTNIFAIPDATLT